MNHNLCPNCNNTGKYLEYFDSFYCPDCDNWLEPICEDKECRYCSDRPEKPSLQFLPNKKTYSDLIGDLMEYNHFVALTVSGSIITEDGYVESVFIDGIHRPEIYIEGGWILDPDSKFYKHYELLELGKAFPDKVIQLEWCT
jgi:hypothetical protein